MWKLTIQDDQGTKPVVVHFVRDEYTIGRDEGNAVRLTERNISRHHARMLKSSDAWRLQDLGSYNGCYVNGARVVDTQALQHGDLIQLGDYRLSIEDEAVGTGRTDGVLTLPGRPGINTQADRLVMMAGPGAGQEFVLNADRMVLGRGEECDISINHPSVSRVHAEIRKLSEGRYEFVDLGSANGVRVNGAEMPSTLLDGRDVIELGDVFLKYLPAGEIYIAGADEPARPSPSVPPHRMSTSVKVAIGLLVATVAVVLGLALRGTEAPPAPIAQPGAADRLAQIMKDARALLAKGDWEAAMQKVSSIPEGSNLRQSQEFKAIQDAWADALFDKAIATEDAAEKRSALDRIASSPSVDPARRKRAADELDAMQRPAVNVADLPSDDMTIERAPAPPPPPAPTAADTPTVTTAHAAAPKPATPPKPATAAPKPTAAAPKPTAAPKPEKGSGTLVRKNPFDDE
ncbi:MAG TPA: FHA domain-containing protein [Polyangiaceae bacterium]|nr:FHA domain-containing protein [Polyangiaceae bacterium]